MRSDDTNVEATDEPVPYGRDKSRSVLDASAVLALLFAEAGADQVASHIAAGAVISAANLSEVATTLVRRDLDWKTIVSRLSEQVDVEAVSSEDALAAAQLYQTGKRVGLSLGDRLCLALALRLQLPAVTAERAWPGLSIDVEVLSIRPGPATQ